MVPVGPIVQRSGGGMIFTTGKGRRRRSSVARVGSGLNAVALLWAASFCASVSSSR